MFGREPNFLHVVKFLRLPGEAIILPLLGKGKREAAPTIKKRRLVEGGGGRCRHAWSGDGEAFSAWLCHGLRSWRGGSKGAG